MFLVSSFATHLSDLHVFHHLHFEKKNIRYEGKHVTFN